uniref:Uncharacterized protein n=1 Tax=Sus scrofa TaxID=9823 RepID=A0A8D0U0N1_PIG
MAGSEAGSRGSSPQPHHSDWGRLEAAILSGWRSFWQSVGKERAAPRASPEEADEEGNPLSRLPVSVGRRPRRTQGRAGRGARLGGFGGPLWAWSVSPLWAWPVSRHLPTTIPGSLIKGAADEQERPWC